VIIYALYDLYRYIFLANLVCKHINIICVREHVDMIFKLVAHKFDWQVRYIYIYIYIYI